MYGCLSATRTWYEHFFDMPIEEVPGAPFPIFMQLSQMHVALYRLTTTDEPMWDKEVVRNTADLTVILDRTIARFDEVDQGYGSMFVGVERGTMFTHAVLIMRHLKTSWEPALAKHLGGMPTPNSHTSAGSMHMDQVTLHDPAMLADTIPMEFTDFNWMPDTFGPWEF
jgi:hypothetical protein